MANVVILPIDDRPCTREFPGAVARIGGWTAAIPPEELLGSLNRTARFADLGEWLAEETSRDDVLGVVLSLDTLAYGGTTAARRCSDSFDQVRSRLEILPRLKGRQPDLPLLAFSVIMRLSDSDNDEEEKPYWREYGRRIYAYSQASDHLQATGQGDEGTLRDLEKAIPPTVLADYLAGRERNHRINRLMVEWASSGVLDGLVLTQDDTGRFGFNVRERRILEEAVREHQAQDRVLIYPGADEVASTLVARLINRHYGRHPHVYVRYCRSEDRSIVTRYEDRPLEDLVNAHLQSASAVRADCPQEADVLLFLHAPAGRQRDLWLEGPGTASGDLCCPWLYGSLRRQHPGLRRPAEELQFVMDMKQCLEGGRQVALADVAFANGADDSLMGQVAGAVPLTSLLAYAAWNTAGNTLGTVIAHASTRLVALEEPLPDPQGAEGAHLHFLVERLLDDWLYQGRVRTHLKELALNGDTPAERLGQEIGREASALFMRTLKGRELNHWRLRGLSPLRITQPWGRLFEAGFSFHLDLEPIR